MLDVFIALDCWCLTSRDFLSAPRREDQVEERHSTEITVKEKMPSPLLFIVVTAELHNSTSLLDMTMLPLYLLLSFWSLSRVMSVSDRLTVMSNDRQGFLSVLGSDLENNFS